MLGSSAWELKINSVSTAQMKPLTKTNKIGVGVIYFSVPLSEIRQPSVNRYVYLFKFLMSRHILPSFLEEFEDGYCAPNHGIPRTRKCLLRICRLLVTSINKSGCKCDNEHYIPAEPHALILVCPSHPDRV